MTTDSGDSDPGYCKEDPGNAGLCLGQNVFNTAGSLSGPTFNLDGTSYEVIMVAYRSQDGLLNPTGLYFAIAPGLPRATELRLTLCIGGSAWALADANRGSNTNQSGVSFRYVAWTGAEVVSPIRAGSTYSLQLTFDGCSSSQSRSRSASSAPTPWIDPRTCEDFDQSIVVNNQSAGAQCQDVTDAGIGNDEVIKAGYLDAVDVWGYVAPGTEVCFAQQGEIVMLDAATSPRRLMRLNAYESNSRRCARIDRAGTVVLMTRAAADRVAPLPTSVTRAGCTATVTAFMLNFRSTPNYGSIIGGIARGAQVSVTQRDGDWLGVVYARSTGWIHSGYATLSGECGGMP